MKYRHHIFDCDGVILDSNKIKSQAFFDVTSEYSANLASEATKYYKETAGTPRVEKVYYFFRELLKSDVDDSVVQQFLAKFNNDSLDKLFKCSLISGVREYLERNKDNVDSFIVSGTPQDELQTIIKKKGLFDCFADVLGSPKSKTENLEDLIRKHNIQTDKAVFFGDSKIDYESANKFNIDFVFVTEKSEFDDFHSFFKGKDVRIIKNFNDLM